MIIINIKLITNFIGHFKTITAHKMLVLKYCFRLGLYKQGLLHDMSKYVPIEFYTGIKYFQGNRSPNNVEREHEGYSKAWLHHKGRNRHHFEYWIDFSSHSDTFMAGAPMPTKYIVEMFCDRIAASIIYRKNLYTCADPYNYFKSSKDHLLMHPDTKHQIESFLLMLKEKEEDFTFNYIKNHLRKKGS